MKYNASLDMLALAVSAFNQGKIEQASVIFAKAAKHASAASALKIINASNTQASKASTSLTASIAKRVKAASGFDANIDLGLPGEELRDPVEDHTADEKPIVEEGAFGEDDEDEDEDEKEEAKARTVKASTKMSKHQVVFARQLKNLSR